MKPGQVFLKLPSSGKSLTLATEIGDAVSTNGLLADALAKLRSEVSAALASEQVTLRVSCKKIEPDRTIQLQESATIEVDIRPLGLGAIKMMVVPAKASAAASASAASASAASAAAAAPPVDQAMVNLASQCDEAVLYSFVNSSHPTEYELRKQQNLGAVLQAIHGGRQLRIILLDMAFLKGNDNGQIVDFLKSELGLQFTPRKFDHCIVYIHGNVEIVYVGAVMNTETVLAITRQKNGRIFSKTSRLGPGISVSQFRMARADEEAFLHRFRQPLLTSREPDPPDDDPGSYEPPPVV